MLHSRTFDRFRSPRSAAPRQPPSLPSPEDDARRLLSQCKVARGNADLLHEALVYAKPEDLKESELIQEFYSKCRKSQESIISQIPWASAEAERSRAAAPTEEETTEEMLLAELLIANERLTEALKMFDDLERVTVEAEAKNEQRIEALTVVADFVPSTDEAALLDRLFALGDPQHSGFIDVDAAGKILARSGLTPSILSSIWEIANVEDHPGLSRESLGIALRLVGHAQKGASVSAALALEPGPLATFGNIVEPGPVNNEVIPGLSPMTEQDKNKYMNIFLKSGPQNGVINSQQAHSLFLKSKLPATTLSQIWTLADTNARGILDAEEFAVAMHLINASMSGKLSYIPNSLPRGFYEQSDVQPPLPPLPSPSLNANGAGPSAVASGSSTPNLRLTISPPDQEWVITPTLKAYANSTFDVHDPQKLGHIAGDAIYAFMLDSGLPVKVLERIWDLADTSQRGSLTREEFSVAVFLLEKAKEGKEMPHELPPSLVASALSVDDTEEDEVPGPSNVSPHSDVQPIVQPDRDIWASSAPNSPQHESSSPTAWRARSPDGTSAAADLAGLFPVPPTPTTASGSSPVWHGQTHSPAASPPASPISPSHLNRSSTVISLGSAFSTPRAPPRPRRSHSATVVQRLDVSPSEKRRADKFFDMLDPWKRGQIEGDVAGPFFAKSKLPEEVLAHIWDLADHNHDGHLTRDEFAVAMHLIWREIAGKDIPQSAPLSINMPSGRPSVTDRNSSPGPLISQSPVADAELVSDTTHEAERSSTPPPPYASIDTGT